MRRAAGEGEGVGLRWGAGGDGTVSWVWFAWKKAENGEEKKKKIVRRRKKKGGSRAPHKANLNWQISALVSEISWPQFFFFLYTYNKS